MIFKIKLRDSRMRLVVSLVCGIAARRSDHPPPNSRNVRIGGKAGKTSFRTVLNARLAGYHVGRGPGGGDAIDPRALIAALYEYFRSPYGMERDYLVDHTSGRKEMRRLVLARAFARTFLEWATPIAALANLGGSFDRNLVEIRQVNRSSDNGVIVDEVHQVRASLIGYNIDLITVDDIVGVDLGID